MGQFVHCNYEKKKRIEKNGAILVYEKNRGQCIKKIIIINTSMNNKK
jgi:hypothetical protein